MQLFRGKTLLRNRRPALELCLRHLLVTKLWPHFLTFQSFNFLICKRDISCCKQQRMIWLTWEKRHILEGDWIAYGILGNAGVPGRTQRPSGGKQYGQDLTEEQPAQDDTALLLSTGHRHWCCHHQKPDTPEAMPRLHAALDTTATNTWCHHSWHEFSPPPSLSHLLQMQSSSKGAWLSELKSLIHIGCPCSRGSPCSLSSMSVGRAEACLQALTRTNIGSGSNMELKIKLH